MMDQFQINNVRITHTPVVQAGGRVSNLTRVSIMVGEHGPFLHDFPEGQDSVEAINAWKLSQVNYVRNIVGA